MRGSGGGGGRDGPFWRPEEPSRANVCGTAALSGVAGFGQPMPGPSLASVWRQGKREHGQDLKGKKKYTHERKGEGEVMPVKQTFGADKLAG